MRQSYATGFCDKALPIGTGIAYAKTVPKHLARSLISLVSPIFLYSEKLYFKIVSNSPYDLVR